MNELISVCNGLNVVDDYLDTPSQNDVIYCIMDECFDSDSIAPWWTFDEYADEFTKACDGYVVFPVAIFVKSSVFLLFDFVYFLNF